MKADVKIGASTILNAALDMTITGRQDLGVWEGQFAVHADVPAGQMNMPVTVLRTTIPYDPAVAPHDLLIAELRKNPDVTNLVI